MTCTVKGSVPDDDSSGTSVREHESNDDTGFASAESVGVSGLKKLFEGLKASTPMKQRTSPHGSAQIEEQNFGVEPEKKTTKAKTNCKHFHFCVTHTNTQTTKIYTQITKPFSQPAKCNKLSSKALCKNTFAVHLLIMFA